MNKVVQIAADDFLKIVCRWFLQAGVCENHFLFSVRCKMKLNT